MRKLLIGLFLLMSLGASCQSSEIVYDLVEQMPVFPGGEDSMRHFLLYNLQYPEYSRTHHIEGRVDVRFLVDQNGDISNVVAEKGQIRDINAEAVRVVRLFPRFTPGIHEGRPVKVIVILPIIFQLDDFDIATGKRKK